MRNRASRRVLYLVSLGVVLVAANSRGWLNPVKSAVGFVTSPLTRAVSSAGRETGNFVFLYTHVRRISADNSRLETQVAELRKRLSEDAELRQQNESLRKQLNFGEAQPRKLIPAEVIAYQPDNFRQFLSIGRGRRDGIKEGMAVIAEGTLVGRVSEVTESTAKVFMVVDPNFKVNGLDQESRATGTVHGQLGTGLVMDKIAQNDPIKPGDTIITSGLGGELPKGIIIGRVESVNQKDNEVFQAALLSSNLRFNRLELVYAVVGQ